MAGKHRGGKDQPRKDGSRHVHDWVLIRQEKKDGHIYEFYRCGNPNCPSPDRMEIR